MPNNYSQIFQNKFKSFKFIKKTEANLEKVPLLNLLYISLSITLITFLTIFLVKSNLPPEVPLFYGNADGQGQLAGSLGLAIPSLVSLTMTVVNTLISFLLEKKFLKQILSLTSFAISIFATITTFKIIFLVGSF